MAEKKDTKSGFSAEERAAMKERAAELKAQAKGEKAEEAMLEVIAKLPDGDRQICEKLVELVKANAPGLVAKTYYGMPGYANKDGKMVVFVQPATKFNTRYATVGFEHAANLDDGDMWETAFAVLKIGPAEEKKLAAMLKKAVS